MASYTWVDIDTVDVDIRHAIWCDKTGLNDGSVSDFGELQGATISTIGSITVSPATGLAINSSNKNITTIHGITYGINTVVNVWMTATANGDYVVTIPIVTSDNRTLNRAFAITVRDL